MIILITQSASELVGCVKATRSSEPQPGWIANCTPSRSLRKQFAAERATAVGSIDWDQTISIYACWRYWSRTPARVGHDRLPRTTLAGEARHQREKRRNDPEGTGD